MSKIKFLRINNFLGINERELDAAKVNIIKGPKGSGKTSIVEAIEKSFTNKNRRTEVIKHGENEAELFVECTDGLQIQRKIRNDKADYFKLRKNEEGIPSTEKFLKSLINGDIFRPLDWINMSIKEQTKSILSMLNIEWSKDDIVNWFGELPSNIDFDKHILLILKSIEEYYYKTREEVNREIKELKVRMKDILDELPAEYNGDEWKNVDIKDYYNKVAEAQHVNNLIDKAKALKEGFEDKVNSIKSDGESKKTRINLKYKTDREDIKDIISLSESKIEKANTFINSSNEKLENELQKLDNELEKEKQELIAKYNELKEKAKNRIAEEVEEQKELINISNTKIAAKKQELLGLDEKEQLELKAVDDEIETSIEKVKATIGNASKFLDENEPIDIEPLQAKADEVSEMVSYLREWDRVIDIRDNKLSPKERYSNDLTEKIEKARALPSELLKTAEMPVEGISVDSEGRIRINNTLIDGLSDGEKLDLSMRIAKAQCGEVKVICIDKFESLDSKAQEHLIDEMSKDEYQYFVTEVSDTENGEIEIDKIGDVENE